MWPEFIHVPLLYLIVVMLKNSLQLKDIINIIYNFIHIIFIH